VVCKILYDEEMSNSHANYGMLLNCVVKSNWKGCDCSLIIESIHLAGEFPSANLDLKEAVYPESS